MNKKQQTETTTTTDGKIESIREEYVQRLNNTREKELDIEKRFFSQIRKLLEKSYF